MVLVGLVLVGVVMRLMKSRWALRCMMQLLTRRGVAIAAVAATASASDVAGTETE